MMLLKMIPELLSSELECKKLYKNLREKIGVKCKKCGSHHHHWLKTKWQWQCRQCKFRTTLRSGTAIQHSHLPFKLWFECVLLMIALKKGISAKEMQRQLGYRRYKTIWYMMHRIRGAMGNEEARILQEILQNQLEGRNDENCKNNSSNAILLKRDAFVFNKFDLKQKPNVKYSSRGCIPKGQDETFFVAANRACQARLLEKFRLRALSSTGAVPKKQLTKWESIFKRSFVNQMAGIHHRVNLNYLQRYLDEFTYRLNRRFQENIGLESLLSTIIRV